MNLEKVKGIDVLAAKTAPGVRLVESDQTSV